jgi:hypothetical protein
MNKQIHTMKKIITLFAIVFSTIGMAQPLGVAYLTVTTSGNPNTPNGIWPNQLITIIDSNAAASFSFTFLTDQNGVFADTIPLLNQTGNLMLYSVCNGASVLQAVVPYQTLPSFAVVNLSTNLNICSNTTGSNGIINVSGMLFNTANPMGVWANETVYIEERPASGGSMTYTDITNSMGEFNQSFSTQSFSGYIKLYAFNCIGDSVVANLPYQLNSVNDSANLVAFVVDSCAGNPNPVACNVSFVVDTVNSFQGQVVLWNVSQSSFPNSITQYVWDFGDGSIVVGQYPIHQYAQAGSYNVCLTMYELDNVGDTLCTSTYCDSLGMDLNGNLIYKGTTTGFGLVVIDPATIGLNEDVAEIVAYPNPADQQIELTGLDGKEVNYFIFDMSGRSIQEGQLDAGASLNTSNISNGLYLLNIQSNDRLETIRIQIKR